ncbi:MAG: S8 family serine peptidase, partial [Deltaproteobacteria bacterium]|nr:S8 family serine peptidase [Deltaproteobacteria bacterium]
MTQKRTILSAGKFCLFSAALIIGLGLALLLFNSPIELGCSVAAEDSSGASFRGIAKIAQPGFVAAMTDQDRADIIVLLKDNQSPADENVSSDARKMAQRQAAVRSLEEKVITAVPATDFSVKTMYQNFPGLAGTATLKGIKALAAMDEVTAIQEDHLNFPQLRQGIPMIKADAFHTAGYRGTGVAVAIVDTGVDYTNPKLGGGKFPNSKVIGGYNFGDGNADPMDCDGHGTACAGIVAGDLGDTGDYIGGVASDAKIYGLKIIAGCGGTASDSTIAAAWDWCVTHKNDNPAYPIMVISTSFGGDYYQSYCDQAVPVYVTSASSALANGITLFVSSGNDGYCDGIGSPACVSKVISVGAVYDANIGTDLGWCVQNQSCVKIPATGCNGSGLYCQDQTTAADKVTCYSNSANILDILAPSNNAYTTGLVSKGGYNETFGGTSAACPYAAGAAALLQSYYKATTGAFKSPAELKNELVATGRPITDPKSRLTKPRVSLVLGPALAFKDGIWAAGGPQKLSVYYQTYNNGGAVCVASTDGKNIISCYAASTTDQVFEGTDIPTGKTYRIHIDFASSTTSTLIMTTLSSGTTVTYNMTKQTAAQPNPLSDGVWQANPDSTQQFFFQTYVGGGALMLYTSNATTAKVFYANQVIEEVFSGNDIYSPPQDKMDAKLI